MYELYELVYVVHVYIRKIIAVGVASTHL